MVETNVTVKNRAGIHTRPAASIVKLSSKFSSDIYLIRDGFAINAKSIIGVMTLAAEQGANLTIRADGEDEELASKEMKELFDSGFGEP
ncbi:MAG: HPr family phosphocarrier protein [Candidatus Kapabacteria bacterium]|nr:HPr family phosphocarrier protein [Candidatus Kapabacteria bacterium]